MAPLTVPKIASLKPRAAHDHFQRTVRPVQFHNHVDCRADFPCLAHHPLHAQLAAIEASYIATVGFQQETQEVTEMIVDQACDFACELLPVRPVVFSRNLAGAGRWNLRGIAAHAFHATRDLLQVPDEDLVPAAFPRNRLLNILQDRKQALLRFAQASLGAHRNGELERAYRAPPREASFRLLLRRAASARLDDNRVKLFTGDLPHRDVVLIALVYSCGK